MILLNFSHPLTSEHLSQIAAVTKQPVEQIIDIKVQFDNEKPFEAQLQEVFESVKLTSTDLQTKAIIVNLPSLNTIAALVLAELHGRMGYFPPVLRLRPMANSTPTQFEVAETLNLQTVRERGRKER